MKRYMILAAAALMAATQPTEAQVTIDRTHLEGVKAELNRPMYSKAYGSLMERADRLVSGEEQWKRAGEAVADLGMAWYLSGEERYAEKGGAIIEATLLKGASRISPDSEEAERLDVTRLVDGASLLTGSKSWSRGKEKDLKRWMREYTDHYATLKGEWSMEKGSDAVAACLYAGLVDKAAAIINGLDVSEVTPRDAVSLADILDMCHIAGLPEDWGALSKAMDAIVAGLPEATGQWQAPEETRALQETLKGIWRIGKRLPGRGKEYCEIYDSRRIFDPESRFTLTYYTPDDVDDAFANASLSLRHQISCVREAEKKENNRRGHRVNPHSIHKEGSIRLNESREWTSGFFPGELWIMYDFTHDPYWREEAASFTWVIEDAKTYGGTHDLGFMFNDSFGQGWRLTGERSYFDVAHQAAKTLLTRYSPRVGLIRSWDHNREVWKYPVIIDNMMNLELLFEMSRATGEETFSTVAKSHADNTLRNHFRPDHSSYHVVDYDPATGDVRMKVTAQGYSDHSYWSRGQGWGLYGFTMCYRYTGDKRYLEHAKGIADFILGYNDMPSDGIPYWDMMAPGTEIKDNPEVPRDASAGALIATSLYELSDYVEPENCRRYRVHADKILSSLSSDSYTLAPEAKQGYILDHSTGSKPHNSEVDVPLVYADYYYLQALNRKHMRKRRGER